MSNGSSLFPELPTRTPDELKCELCGKWLVETPDRQYITCPDLHGMLQMPLTTAENEVLRKAKGQDE